MKQKNTIFILDDSSDLLEALKLFLKKHYNITTANSIQEFNLNFKSQATDLLLLDVFIDGVTLGREICNHLKSNIETDHIPIILMSANPSYLLNFEECKADAIVEKPFNILHLLSVTTGLINLYDERKTLSQNDLALTLKDGLTNLYVRK